MDNIDDQEFSHIVCMPLYKYTNTHDKNTEKYKLIVKEEDKLCNQCREKGEKEDKKCYGKTHEIYDSIHKIKNVYNFKKINKYNEPEEYLVEEVSESKKLPKIEAEEEEETDKN